MTVEEKRRGCSNGENEPKEDQFPVGMRVLAVDDDRICLRMLEALLRRCQYHVTTTTQAVTALKMLRENENKYDLIISDVHMPDMDGFKLLELVGLEMDLPVIMLSADGDTQFVMKGITHGACDYLLKPVRLEELKNIWQHVVRKKKPDCRDNNFENSANPPEGGQGLTAGHDDQNANLNRKRKDQDEDEDDDSQENGEENEDPSAQKKPRVVWSVDLHLKFVAAVNQLGLDKAVPKKILDLMNVERLTRENVASHLQKYRLYLKRLSSDSMATSGSKDPSYLCMYDGIGNFHSLTRSGQLPNAQLGSFPPSGVIGRLNTPASLGVRGLPSGLIQHGYTQNSLHSINDLSKLQSVISAGNRNVNLIKGMPTSLELDQLQQNRSISRVGELSTAIDDPSHFPLASGYLSAGMAVRNSSNPFRNVSNNALLLQGHSQQTQNQGGFGIQSSISIPSVNPGTFQTGVGVSSQLPDHGRCNENWQGDVPLNGFPSNTLPMSDPFSHVSLPPRNFKENFSPLASHNRNNQLDFSSASVVAPSLQDSRRDAENQAAPTGNDMRHDNLNVSNFGATSIAVGQKISYNMQQQREDNKQDYTHNVNIMVNSPNLSLPMNGGLNSHVQNLGQDKAGCNTKRDSTLISHSYNGSPFTMYHNEASMSMRGDYNLDRSKSQSGLLTNSSGSLEDLMNAMVKQENNEILLMDGGMGCNVYPVRTCI